MTIYDAQLNHLPREIVALADKRRDILVRTLAALFSMWPLNRPQEPLRWFDTNAETFSQVLGLAQFELSLLAMEAVDQALEIQGDTTEYPYTFNPESLIGITGTGAPTMGLAFAAASTVVAFQESTPEPAPYQIAAQWTAAGKQLAVAAKTTLSDTSRQAKLIQAGARPGTGYIRLLRPPSCSRCAILAGIRAQSPKVGFNRHPNCDCDAIAIHDYKNRANEPQVKKWRFDSEEYFNALSAADQNKIFTKAGAQAIRDGADMRQVINARRGMTTATDGFGVKKVVTTEGTTRRGFAYDYLRRSYQDKMRKQAGGQYFPELQAFGRSRTRLMPETIYKIAGDDSDLAVSLLHKNGYLTETSPNLGQKFSWATRDKDVLAAQERFIQRIVERTAS